MFARTEIVGGKIRAGTKVFTRICAANCDSIAIAVLRVGHLKVREHRLVADILDLEGLRASKLAPQLGLPSLDVHTHRAAQMGHGRFMSNPANFTGAVLARFPLAGGF